MHMLQQLCNIFSTLKHAPKLIVNGFFYMVPGTCDYCGIVLLRFH